MSDLPVKSRVSRGNNKKKTPRNDNSRSNGFRNALESPDDDASLDESQQCVICAERIIYGAYSPCQHKTCHKCCLRQRVLYKRDICLICRTPGDNVIISEEIDRDYTSFKAEQLTLYNDKFKIYFTSEQAEKDCLDLLELKCHYKDCGINFATFKELQEHIKQEHNKYFCLICYNNKKAFISELALYHYKSLQTHQTIGDEKGFKGHPACKHCSKKRFYSEDELNIHIRDNHERCHICDQDIPAVADYYKNYDELYEHFRLDHYVCLVQICLDKKFVVFREDLDLTAHMLKEHGSLTGANNKIVFGAGRAYQSQLSTYQHNNNSRNGDRSNKKSGDGGTSEDSMNVKRMRLEERAKHYLEYDNDKIEEFNELNGSFRSNNLTADELNEAYKQLFNKRSTEEILIIMTEFAELFPESGAKYKQLQENIKKTQKAGNASEFPLLGGRLESPALNLHGWGGSPSGSKSSLVDSFPALQKPQKNKQSVNLNQKPIRYATVTKNQPVKPVPVSIHSFNNDTSYRPSYLENSSSSSSPSLSRTGSPAGPSSNSDPKNFPKLEKKTTRKAFPRVNPVNITPSLQWGLVQTPSKAIEEEFGFPIIDKRKQKQKKK